jgi:hypothetical protein
MYDNLGDALLSTVAQSGTPQSLRQYKSGGAYEVRLENPAIRSP